MATPLPPCSPGKGFGSSAGDRFAYVNQSKERASFSCLEDLQGSNTRRRDASYSFGVSRANIKPIFVEEVTRNAKDQPGPNDYGRPNYFGKR